MNIPEIRSSFSTMEVLTSRIRRLRFERLSQIRAKELPVSLEDGAILVLHLFPLRSFEPGFLCDFTTFWEGHDFCPMKAATGWSHTHDLDRVYVAETMRDATCRGYSAILRTGCVEVVQRTGPEKWIPNPDLEASLIHFLPRCVKWLQVLRIDPPIVVMLSFLDIGGHILFCGPMRLHSVRPIKQRDLIMHSVFVESFETPAAEILRPFCDSIWHSCGLQRSFNFNESGRWHPQDWQ